ncbi:MAG: aspartate carbamoyltransferase regulatory subunit [Nitrososphaeria archaeon]
MDVMTEKELLVQKIRNGTVIDHIVAGKALQVLSILGVSGSEGKTITVAMNVPSRKYGRKDIIKIENTYLSSEITNKISLITPHATVNIIKEYEVIEKRPLELPEEFIGLFKCPNPNCITNSDEPIETKFYLTSKDPPLLRCRYCGRIYSSSEVI